MLSFEEFRRVPQTVMEDHGDTVFYTWRAVDRPTTVRLERFVQDLATQGRIPIPAKFTGDLHMSIIRAENELMNYVPDKQTIRVKPVQWRLLGTSPNYYLCLITDVHPRITQQIEIAKKQKAEFVFPTFLPHVSVALYRTKQVSFEDLPVPQFQIVLEAEERHHFDPQH